MLDERLSCTPKIGAESGVGIAHADRQHAQNLCEALMCNTVQVWAPIATGSRLWRLALSC